MRSTRHPSLPNGRVTGGYVAEAVGGRRDARGQRMPSVSRRPAAAIAPGHPLANLAEMNYRNAGTRSESSSISRLLTHWLAGKASVPYYHIDPLRVDFTRVAEVMSSSYATTYSILPVAVSGDEVTITTCEPFPDRLGTRDRADHEEVGSGGVVEPARHRALHDRVLQACAAGQEARPSRARLRWCRASSNWSSSAARSRPTTRTSYISSTGCCSTRSISAPATSIWSRAASSASRASASTVCCTRCTRCRPA